MDGFAWINFPTAGVVIWSDLFLYDPPNGEKIAIILMDTEGLNFDPTSTTDNSKILSLTALISSMQIFNLLGDINESDLQYLQSALVDLTGQLSSSEKVKTFQNIMLLIRDWLQPDDYDYGLSGGQEMLDERTKENEVLEYINQSYEKVSCFLMPPPGDNATSKQEFDGRWSELDPEFINQLKFLVSVLLAPKNILIKAINKKSLGANEIYNCVLQYADNKGDIPDAKSIYEATVITHMQNVIDESMLAFNNNLHDNLQNLKSIDEIDDLYEKAKESACNVFERAKKIGTAEQINQYQQNLPKKLKDTFLKWKPKAFMQLKKSIEQQKILKRADDQEKMLRQMKEDIANERLVQDERSKKGKRDAEDFVAKLLAEKIQTQRDQLQRSSEKQSNELRAHNDEEKKVRELKVENDRVNKAHDEALKLVAQTKKAEEKARKDAEEAIETLREKNDQYDQRQKELEQQAIEDREAQAIQEERISELMMEIERLENEAKEDQIKSAKEIKKAAKKLRKLKELLQEERDQAKKQKKKANWFKRHMFKTPNFLFCSADVSADFKFKTAGKPAAALLKLATAGL